MNRSLFMMTCCGSLLLGCAVEAPERGEDVGEARQAQVVPFKTYNITQSNAVVGTVWRGNVASGLDTEFWVKKSSYAAGSTRALVGTGNGTCSTWRSNACTWTGATYYKATFTESTLNCARPPSSITAPKGSISFLGTGSWKAGATAFAWTYVANNVEYWAMDHEVPGDVGDSTDQVKSTPGYSSFSNFTTSVCAMATPPTEWFTAYYTEVPTFCSVNPC